MAQGPVASPQVTGIKTLYEAELGDARRLLDEMARERARLQIDLGRLRAESEEGAKRWGAGLGRAGVGRTDGRGRGAVLGEHASPLPRSAQKRESELAAAVARGRELEARVQRAEAQLAEALGDRQRLEGELAGLRGQLSKVGRPDP